MPIPHLSRALVMEVASGPHCSLTVSAQNEKGQDQAVLRITTAGAVTPYRIPAAISDAFEYCLGPADRSLWFTDQSVTPRLIGRITSHGVATSDNLSGTIRGRFSQIQSMAVGPDGNLYLIVQDDFDSTVYRLSPRKLPPVPGAGISQS